MFKECVLENEGQLYQLGGVNLSEKSAGSLKQYLPGFQRQAHRYISFHGDA